MVANLVMRFMWTLSISPSALGVILPAQDFLFSTIIAGVEILRRAMWNIFRLENEQLNNIGKFRAIDVAVPIMD
jgi:hypothetical protein